MMSEAASGAKAAMRGDDPEARGANQQHAAAAEPIAEISHPDKQSGEHQRVNVNDPELCNRTGAQVSSNTGQGKTQHRVVDRDQKGGQHQHHKCEPLLSRRQDTGLFSRSHSLTIQSRRTLTFWTMRSHSSSR
ncbi:hypothetical protein GCM10009655_08850 [Rhodoglobus aureus]|uniref:Uncharacterized protein n=1 Tax=Rhodoglobus aureus TaxID=191497 RepID=A0ABN1VHM3_9MICO